jgi:hypothetical protein
MTIESSHRTYGCMASQPKPNPDPTKTERVWCQCKAFHKVHMAELVYKCNEAFRVNWLALADSNLFPFVIDEQPGKLLLQRTNLR